VHELTRRIETLRSAGGELRGKYSVAKDVRV